MVTPFAQTGVAGCIVMTGPPGAGKSTIGAIVADVLRVGCVDTDALVVARAGTSIAELFRTRGEPAFRALEREAVAAALTGGPAVVALGGGAILDPATRADLLGGDHRVVFLDVGLDDAARRAGFDRGRPLLAGDPRGRWSALMEGRRALYEQVATWRVDTDGRAPAAVAREVLGLLTPAAAQDEDTSVRSAP